MTHVIVLQSFGFLKRELFLCNLLFKTWQVIPWASFCFGFHLLFWCCVSVKQESLGFGFFFLIQPSLRIMSEAGGNGNLDVLLQVSRTKSPSVPGPITLSLIQLYSALLTAMWTHTDSFGKLTAQYNQYSCLIHSVTVKKKKICMLTTRVNGSLSWALHTSPKQNLTHCSGTFFKPSFLYWGWGIPVWWKTNYNFISLSEIYEVWWLCFKMTVVQIGQFPAPLEPSEVDHIHFCWSDASLGETKPEVKGRKSWSQASANTALSYIHAFLDGTWYREQPIYQGMWEHGVLLPPFLSWLCFYTTASYKRWHSPPHCWAAFLKGRYFILLGMWTLAKTGPEATHCHGVSELYTDSIDTGHSHSARC